MGGVERLADAMAGVVELRQERDYWRGEAERFHRESRDSAAACGRAMQLANDLCDCESMGGRFGAHREECPTARLRAALR